MTFLVLINMLLVLAGPFAVVGVLAAVAVAAGFPRVPSRRPVFVPRPRWVVA
jgi:hypothetical protein